MKQKITKKHNPEKTGNSWEFDWGYILFSLFTASLNKIIRTRFSILTHSFPMYLFSIRFYWCFQGVEKECIGSEWLKNLSANWGEYIYPILFKYIILCIECTSQISKMNYIFMTLWKYIFRTSFYENRISLFLLLLIIKTLWSVTQNRINAARILRIPETIRFSYKGF